MRAGLFLAGLHAVWAGFQHPGRRGDRQRGAPPADDLFWCHGSAGGHVRHCPDHLPLPTRDLLFSHRKGAKDVKFYTNP